jgi:hypothetical protein
MISLNFNLALSVSQLRSSKIEEQNLQNLH